MWKLRLVTVTRQGLLARAGRRGWLRWAEIADGHLEHTRRACSWTASLRMLAGQHLPNRDCMRKVQKQTKQWWRSSAKCGDALAWAAEAAIFPGPSCQQKHSRRFLTTTMLVYNPQRPYQQPAAAARASIESQHHVD